MNRPKDNLLNSNNSTQESHSSTSQLQLWLALAFAILQLLALEGIAIVRFFRSNEPVNRPDLLHHIVAEMLAPLMVCALGIQSYRKIAQTVPLVSGDPAILRAVAFYGAIVLGFAFLTMDLLL
jgi:hypothetical protein